MTSFAALEQHQARLPQGAVRYRELGTGEPIVLIHGLLVNSLLWADAAELLAKDFRVIAPDLPLGSHTQPLEPGADLTPTGLAKLIADFLAALELEGVTLVGNDTGGALVQLLAGDGAARVGRIVLVSCDAFDNFPPGLTGKTLVLTGRLPPTLFGLFMQQMRLRPLRRLPLAFGWLTKRGDAATARWIKPVLEQREIRRDTVRVLREIAAQPDLLLEAAERLPSFERPALVVWASQDRVMPPEHGRRLAELLPRGRLVEIPDSYTLIPLDQPALLVEAVQQFTHESNQGSSDLDEKRRAAGAG
jgi:pimeloyl-ACP methyl ester carboxylesterase